MSPLLKKSFDSSKCKTLLQLTLQRLKVLRNKHALAVKRSRADVAKLLEKGQESSAKAQVESVFTEEKIVALYDLLEHFCQLVINRLESIKSQKQCPSDLKEAVASLIFAAPRCADLEELKKASKLLSSNYGTEFSVAAKELRPDCGVNTQIIQNLSSVSPNSDARLKLLKEIAIESKINWDYEVATADTSKGDAGLLDGPNHFVSGTQFSKEGTHAITNRPRSVSMSMHVNEVKELASTALQNTIGSCMMSSVERSSSLGLPLHNMHQFAKININTETKSATNFSRAPDAVMHTPILDPYALAKAEGKMDYKVVADYMGRAHVTEVHLKSMERTERAHDHSVLLDAAYREDALQRSKEKKANRSRDMMNLARDRKKESKSNHQEDLSTSSEILKGRNEAEPLDLDTAAQIAFASASQADEAAVNMVRMESLERLKGSRVVNANKLQEKHPEPSSGPVWDEHYKLARMDIESSQDNLVASKQVSEPNECTDSDASEDSLKYVVFEQTSSSQTYARSSKQAEEESYAFPQLWSETTQHSSKYSGRVGTCDAEHEDLRSKEVTASPLFDSFYSKGVKEQELDQNASSRKKQDSIFDHADVQQDKYVQNDFSVPQFDDYNSEDTSEEETPFYLKGRAAMAAEEYANRTAWAPSSKTNMLMSTSGFIIDDRVEESSSLNMQSSEQEASLHLDLPAKFLDATNHEEEDMIMVKSSDQNDMQKRSQEPRFDDYARSVSLPAQSFKTTPRSQISVLSTESISESSILIPIADNDNDSSDKLDSPREPRWPSLTSKRSDLDSRYKKMASSLSSIKLQGLSGYEDGDNSNRGNLKWYSGMSEDSESASERSFESHKLNPSSSELNVQSPKPSFYMEDGTGVSKSDAGLTTQVIQVSPGKSYYGISRRSVRSSRTKQTQDIKSPTGDESSYGLR